MMTTTQTQFARKTDSLRTAVRLGVGVIVFDERGWIVLEQRGDCGLWGLPGGRLEPGETIAEAAVREVEEETGLQVEIVSLLGVYSDPEEYRLVTYPGEDESVHIVDVVLEARIVGGTLRASAESLKVGYFPPDDFPSEIAPPAFEPLRDFVRGTTGVIR